jgi:hypothetical protein
MSQIAILKAVAQHGVEARRALGLRGKSEGQNGQRENQVFHITARARARKTSSSI